MSEGMCETWLIACLLWKNPVICGLWSNIGFINYIEMVNPDEIREQYIWKKPKRRACKRFKIIV